MVDFQLHHEMGEKMRKKANPLSAEEQEHYDRMFMLMARSIAENSDPIHWNTEGTPGGAVIVADNKVIATSSDEKVRGIDYSEQVGKKPMFACATTNAIAQLARSSESSENATLYTVSAPTANLAVLLIQAGITRVVYDRKRTFDFGTDMLTDAGIDTKSFDPLQR